MHACFNRNGWLPAPTCTFISEYFRCLSRRYLAVLYSKMKSTVTIEIYSCIYSTIIGLISPCISDIYIPQISSRFTLSYFPFPIHLIIPSSFFFPLCVRYLIQMCFCLHCFYFKNSQPIEVGFDILKH